MPEIKTALAAAALALAGTSVAFAAPVLDPTAQQFINSLAGATPIYDLTPAQARAALDKVQSGPATLAPATVQEMTLAIGPLGKTTVHVVRPEGETGALPVVIYFHGGGWMLGDFKTHERMVRLLADGANAEVVFVDYTPSPEAQYPVAINEDYAVTQYVAANPTMFNIDPTRLAIAGDSVGGNMTAVVSLLDKEQHGPAIKAQVLFYPVTDARMDDASYREFADGPWLTKRAMAWFWDAYLPNVSERADPHVSPLNATVAELKGLPPALVITDENDVLRDEGEAYARKLTQAGVPVTSVRYNGIFHDFVMLNALAGTPEAEGAVTQATDFLRQAFAP